MSREDKIKTNSDETKCSRSDYDIMSMILSQLERLNSKFDSRFDNNEKNFEAKFNVISSDMNSHFDINETN